MTRATVCEHLDPCVIIWTSEGELRFTCPSRRAAHDPAHLYTNEPETIRWIEELPEGSVLWDIGASVGTYALYAARRRHLRVVAFEPSASSYAVLCQNIQRNGLDSLVDAYCIALSGRTALDYLFMSEASAGQSMHAFGQLDTILNKIENPIAQSVPGFTIDRFVELFAPPLPSYVKLDVDSIEAQIIIGGKETLRKHTKSVLVEIDGSSRAENGSTIIAALEEIGFVEDKNFSQPSDTRNVLFHRNS